MKISHEILKTLQRFTTVGVFIFVGFFCVSSESFAGTLVINSLDGVATTSNKSFGAIQGLYFGTVNFEQTLGSGLSGVVDTISVLLYKNDASLAKVKIGLYSCPSSGYIGCTGGRYDVEQTYADDIVGGSGNYIPYLSSDTGDFVNFSLDPSRYYILVTQSDYSNLYLRGSLDSSYSSGECEYWSFATNHVCKSTTAMDISDTGFVILGDQLYGGSYTYNFSPAFGSTTASSNVRIGFDYFAAAQENISQYIILLNDVSTASTSEYSLTGSASSGTHSVGFDLSLVEGDVYTMIPYVCDSGSPPQCFGPFDGVGSFFTVVGSGNANGQDLGSLGQYVFGADNHASSTVCTNKNLLIKYPCMAFYVAGAFLFKPSSTTLNSLASGWNVLENYRAPIGYVGQIKSLMDNLSTTTSTSTAFQYIVSLASSSPKIAGAIAMYKLILSCVIWFAGLWGGVKLATNFM